MPPLSLRRAAGFQGAPAPEALSEGGREAGNGPEGTGGGHEPLAANGKGAGKPGGGAASLLMPHFLAAIQKGRQPIPANG